MPDVDWPAIRRQLKTGTEVRKMCAGAGVRGTQSRRPPPASTLRYWREHAGFPPPVLTIPARGGELELWDRDDVKAWLADRG